MTIELAGDQIERLLWEAGLDCSVIDGNYVSVKPSDRDVELRITDIWFHNGDWFIDSDTYTLLGFREGEIMDESVEDVSNEEELVANILLMESQL